MSAILLSLLLSLLTNFLEYWFTRWLHSIMGRGDLTAYPSADAFRAAKPEFLAKLKWRVWLGKDRVANAGRLFDKAADRYVQPGGLGRGSALSDCVVRCCAKRNFAELAEALTAGLSLD